MFYYYWFVVTIGGLLRMLRIILTTLCTPHPLLTRYSKTFLSVEYVYLMLPIKALNSVLSESGLCTLDYCSLSGHWTV